MKRKNDDISIDEKQNDTDKVSNVSEVAESGPLTPKVIPVKPSGLWGIGLSLDGLQEKTPPQVTRIIERVGDNLHEAEERIKRQYDTIVSSAKFPEEVKETFASTFGFEKDAIQIEKMRSGEGVNSSSHFIVSYQDKKFHMKAALQGSGISVGTRFNEIAHYKLNELLKIGPNVSGGVTRSNMLMIITEDLSERGVGKEGKKVEFSDNKKEGFAISAKKDIVDKIPSRQRDSVHRCALEIVINLCSYADVKENYANTGIKKTEKTTHEGDKIIKEKAFIVDFRLSNQGDVLDKYGTDGVMKGQDYIISQYSQVIGSKLLEEFSSKKLEKDVFEFEEKPEIFKEALKKLFLDEKTGDLDKFQKKIDHAFDYAKGVASKSLRTMNDDAKQIENHEKMLDLRRTLMKQNVEKFLEQPQIREFLEQESQRIKSEKQASSRSTSELISSPTAQKFVGDEATKTPC